MFSKFLKGLDKLLGLRPKGTMPDTSRKNPLEERSFAGGNTLPIQSSNYGFDGKEILEKAGVKFAGIVPGKPLFQYVELPGGWKIVDTERPMWRFLLDEKGRKRAEIYFKAALADVGTHFRVVPRFSASCDRSLLEEKGIATGVVYDGGKEIYRTAPIEQDMSVADAYGSLSDMAETEAEIWLMEHYPEWQDYSAYWD
jgi:hypothetical protein